MTLFLLLLSLLVSVALLSAVSTLGIGRWKQLGFVRILLLITAPVADAWLGFYFLDWLSVSGVTLWAGSFGIGIMSLVLMQPLLVPQRLVVWRLATKNILRRKRQAALLMAGLIVASAIITSSLVVGDSLDATVRMEVEGAWGKTDITVSGFDLSRGERVTVSETLAHDVWDGIQTNMLLNRSIDGQQQGIVASVSASSSDASRTGVTWMAMNSSIDSIGHWPNIGTSSSGIRYTTLRDANSFSETYQVGINEVLADELSLSVGDAFDMGWYVTDDGQRTRIDAQVFVHAIVANEGQGASAGTQAPALFTDLQTAQSMQHLEGRINTIYYAVDTSYDTASTIEPVLDELETVLDRFIVADDVGFSLDVDDSTTTMTLSSSQGLGRISGDVVRSLRGNLSSLSPESTMLEVLQIPMADIEFDNQNLLTLADADVAELWAGQRGLWHSSSSGAGFQIEGDGEAWVWRAEENNRVHDFTLDASGEYGLIATDGSLVVGYEGEVDEEQWASYSFSEGFIAVASDVNRWLALEHSNDSLHLHSFSLDLTEHERFLLNIDVPSTLLSADLFVQDQIYLEIEGLLSSDRYMSALDAFSFTAFETSSPWPSEDGPAAEQALHSMCDGGASISLFTPIEHWCTVPEGLIQWDASTNEVLSLRIPIVSTAGGFGVLPQLFLAFGGSNSPLTVEQGQVLLSQRLSALPLSVNESDFWMKGLIPYAFGDDTAHRLTYGGSYSDIEGFETLSELDSVVLGLVALPDGEVLASGGTDERSLILLSNPDGLGTSPENLTSWLDELANTSQANLDIRAVKVEAAALAEESSGVLASMFLVFGTFTIVAGILLVLTIVMMLAESRRSELGTVRALGISQADARALAVQEGILVSAMASVVGSLVGIVLAWFISIGFQNMFASVGTTQFSFSWEWNSLFAGAVWGFLLAVATLWSSALWTSRLNILQALKGGKTPRSEGVPIFLVLVQIVAVGGCLLSFGLLLIFGFDASIAYFLWVSSGVFGFVVFVPVLTWELPVYLRHKSRFWQQLWRHANRNTLAWLGLGLLIWTVGVASFDPVRKGMEPDEFSFIALGLVEVFAGVLLLTSAAPMVVRRLGKSKLLTKRWGPVIPVSLAYPLAAPVRTAVVMGMFSITVFSVIVLGGYAEQFDNYTSSFVEEAEGEYELLLTGSRSSPITLSENISEWNLSNGLEANIDSVSRIHRGEVFLEDVNGERMPYVVRGFDDAFSLHGGLPLHIWDSSLGSTEKEIWNVVSSREDLVLLDASFGLESLADGSGISMLSFSIGDSISLIDISNPGNTRNVQVAGFLEQSSYLFSAGVWMTDDVVIDQFEGRLTRMYISIDEGATPSADFTDSSVADFSPTGKSRDVRLAAAEMESELTPVLNGKGIQVSVISDEVLVIQSLVLALLGIFEGYLALGLIVGIAGIGVVTVRSVSERSSSIGILRAIGYRKNMVFLTFFIEVSWVSVLGMLNGIVVAVGFHRALYTAFWQEQGASFTLPVQSITMVFVGGWLLVLLATYIPIRHAANIPASAALRAV